MANVTVVDLVKTYPNRGGPLTVLDGIAMEIQHREFAVLLGPSGCGKTTLLRIIAGLDRPTTGEVLVDGKRVMGSDRKRGMVFQSYTSFPWLTVLDNIRFGLTLGHLPPSQIDVVARKFLDLVGLAGFADAYPNQLSGGMRQRVAIARTLAVDPDIILMDEPFGALDSQTRALMHELLLDIWETDHKTVFFVTHDIEEAIFLADTVYICSSRPARIIEKLRIGMARPRTAAMKVSQELQQKRFQIQSLLRSEALDVPGVHAAHP